MRKVEGQENGEGKGGRGGFGEGGGRREREEGGEGGENWGVIRFRFDPPVMNLSMVPYCLQLTVL